MTKPIKEWHIFNTIQQHNNKYPRDRLHPNTELSWINKNRNNICVELLLRWITSIVFFLWIYFCVNLINNGATRGSLAVSKLANSSDLDYFIFNSAPPIWSFQASNFLSEKLASMNFTIIFQIFNLFWWSIFFVLHYIKNSNHFVIIFQSEFSNFLFD